MLFPRQSGGLFSKLDFSTYRRRRWPLHGWRTLPFVAASAFSECNMAWLCDSRCKLPFHCGGRSCYCLNRFGSKRTSEVAMVITDFYHCGSQNTTKRRFQPLAVIRRTSQRPWSTRAYFGSVKQVGSLTVSVNSLISAFAYAAKPSKGGERGCVRADRAVVF